MWIVLSRELRNARELRQPGGGKAFAVGFEPMAFRHHLQGNAVLLHRADQPDTAFNLTVVEHEARRRNLHRGPVGALVDQQDGTMIGKTAEGIIQGHRTIALALGNREKPGFGAGRRMNINRPPVGDDKALGAQRFQPDVIGAGCDRALDASVQQPLEGREENILQLDRERQQPVEEGRDRRKLILDAVRINELQSRRVFEHLERAALDLATRKKHVELAQRITAVLAFEIVLGPEHALPAGLALTARDGAQRVEPASDRGKETLLGLNVGRDRPEQRRLRLVGPVGAAEALDGRIRLPTRLEQIVNPQAAILCRQLGMVAPARAARVGEHEDTLDVIHERRGLGEVGRTGTGFDQQTSALADDAA